MPFLWPNKQCQSIERRWASVRNNSYSAYIITIAITAIPMTSDHFPPFIMIHSIIWLLCANQLYPYPQPLYRQDAMKRQTAGNKFTHRPKISIFAPQGQLVASIHVKFGTTKGHKGSLGHTKFHANRFTRMGTRPPKLQKIPLFGKELSHRGEPFKWFLQFLGLLYAQLSYISVSNLMWFASQVTELLLRNRALVN